MRLLECINDTGYKEEHLQFIENFPVKGELYQLRKKVINGNGNIGYLLEEIVNPIMKNNYEPNFSQKRFREVDKLDIESLMLETENVEEWK